MPLRSFLHYSHSKNIPIFSVEAKEACSSCRICAKPKPWFTTLSQGKLMNSTQPLERLNVNFKGSLPSTTHNKYLFVAIDDFFAFSICTSVQKYLIESNYSVFGINLLPMSCPKIPPGWGFLAREIKEYLLLHGVASSKTTPYCPQGNAQMVRCNGIIWKTICFTKKSKNWP